MLPFLFYGKSTTVDYREKKPNEEVNMNNEQNESNIVEAHGSKWEITHSVTSEDMVNKPNHYAVFETDDMSLEAIRVIASTLTHAQFTGYCMGNTLKYRLRVGKKDNIEQELAKADKYQELYHTFKHLTIDYGLE